MRANTLVGKELLKQQRLSARWTQVELASKLGTTQANVSSMESGSRAISRKTAILLADLFKTPDWRRYLS